MRYVYILEKGRYNELSRQFQDFVITDVYSSGAKAWGAINSILDITKAEGVERKEWPDQIQISFNCEGVRHNSSLGRAEKVIMRNRYVLTKKELI